jgi:hypothetical protein
MNKKRMEKAVRADKTADAEAAARAVNALPWEPMPGMVKRQCPGCRYFYAAPTDNKEPHCPDCMSFGSRAE